MICLYIHRRADGAVFYVGAGSPQRAQSKASRSAAWRAQASGHTVHIIDWLDTNLEAADAEADAIALLRDMGAPLVNVRHGGEGLYGRRPEGLDPVLVMNRIRPSNHTNSPPLW